MSGPPASVPHRLADGSPPASPEDLFRRLRELDIPCSTVEHPAVFTVEQARELRGPLPGHHVKNLFLRDKKGRRMWLVVCLERRAVDLRALAAALGARHLSFGSPRRLMEHLGVVPGAVTPLAVVNDRMRRVEVVLDQDLTEGGPLNFHPLDNTMTTSISVADFLRFMEAEGHAPTLLDLDGIGE